VWKTVKVGWLVGQSLTALLTQFTSYRAFKVELYYKSNQIKSNLFAISSVDNITIHKFALCLAGQTGDNFSLMSAQDLMSINS